MDLSISLCFVFYVWFTCCLLLLFLAFAIYELEFFAILPLTSRWSCYDPVPVEPNFPHLLRLEQKDFQDSALHHMKRLGIKALGRCFSQRVGKVKTRFLITLSTFSRLKFAKAVVDKTAATIVRTKAMDPGTHKKPFCHIQEQVPCCLKEKLCVNVWVVIDLAAFSMERHFELAQQLIN